MFETLTEAETPKQSMPMDQFDDIRFIKRIDIIPVYDYDLLKSRHVDIHKEYRTVYKFFSRLIRIKYDTPIAVAVSK